MHRHPAPKEAVEVPVMLHHRTGHVVDSERAEGFVYSICWQIGIQALEGCAQIASQHRFLSVSPTERTAGPEGLIIPSVDALPPELLFQMLRKGGLNQAILTVDRS